jgi:hypothetical protein
MAVFGSMQLTTQGQALYTKAQTGTTLTFTRMQIGGGQLASGQDQTKLTALISPIAYFNINSETANGNTASIKGIFENTNLTSSTYVCEIGLFAQDPTAGEILYSYANAGTLGDTLPPYANGPISRQFNINVAVGNATSVTATIPSNTYIPTTQLGVANGVATLDNTGKVPTSQLPSMNYIPTSAEGAPSGVATLDSSGKVPTTQIPALGYVPTGAEGAPNGVATLDSNGFVPKAQLGNSPTSVNGKTGVVTLTATDVGAASSADFTAHTADNVIHITAAERTTWNATRIRMYMGV